MTQQRRRTDRAQSGKLRLDDQLCFALYAATNAVMRSYRPRLEQIGLTYLQYLVMMVLWQHGPCPASRIAASLGLAAEAVAGVLGRLEAGGLVRRCRDPQRPAGCMELTDKGVELEAAASDAQQDVVCRTELEPGALAELREALKALVLRMEPNRFSELQATLENPAAQRQEPERIRAGAD